jgi:hypothetical protein
MAPNKGTKTGRKGPENRERVWLTGPDVAGETKAGARDCVTSRKRSVSTSTGPLDVFAGGPNPGQRDLPSVQITQMKGSCSFSAQSQSTLLEFKVFSQTNLSEVTGTNVCTILSAHAQPRPASAGWPRQAAKEGTTNAQSTHHGEAEEATTTFTMEGTSNKHKHDSNELDFIQIGAQLAKLLLFLTFINLLLQSHLAVSPLEMAGNLKLRSEQLISQISCPRRLSGVEFHADSNELDFIQIGAQLAKLLLFLTFINLLLQSHLAVSPSEMAGNLKLRSEQLISQISLPRSLIAVEFHPESNALDFIQIRQQMTEILLFLCSSMKFMFTFRCGKTAANLNFGSKQVMSRIVLLRGLMDVEFHPESIALDFIQIRQVAELLLFLCSNVLALCCAKMAANLNLTMRNQLGNHSFINDYHG